MTGQPPPALAAELVATLVERHKLPLPLAAAVLAQAVGMLAARLAAENGQGVPQQIGPLCVLLGRAAANEQYRLAALERAELPAEKVN